MLPNVTYFILLNMGEKEFQRKYIYAVFPFTFFTRDLYANQVNVRSTLLQSSIYI